MRTWEWIVSAPGVLNLRGTQIQVRRAYPEALHGKPAFVVYDNDWEIDWRPSLADARKVALQLAVDLSDIGLTVDEE